MIDKKRTGKGSEIDLPANKYSGRLKSSLLYLRPTIITICSHHGQADIKRGCPKSNSKFYQLTNGKSISFQTASFYFNLSGKIRIV